MINLTEENKKTLLTIFSKNMTAYRKAMKISQKEFGELIGITRQTVSSIERGAYNLTWPIFLSSLLVFSGNAQSRQMVLNSVAGDNVLTSYLESMMPVKSTKNVHEFNEVARQIEYAYCVISDEPGCPIKETDSNFRELSGIEENEFPSFFDCISEDDTPVVKKILEEKIKKQMYVNLEFKLLSKDGGGTSVNCVIRRQKKLMKDGLFDVIITPLTGGVLHDHSVSGMMDVIPVGTVIYEINRDSESGGLELYYANEAFYDVIGHSKERFANIHNNDIVNIISVDDARKVKRIFTVHEEDSQMQIDARVNVFEGDPRWVHINSKVIRSDDSLSIVVLVLTNITTRINQEMTMKYQLDRYRQLDEVLEDIQFNYEVDEDKFTIPVMFGKFVTGNNVIKHFIAEGKSRNYVHPEDNNLYQTQWSNALAKGGKSTAEYRLKIKDNTYHWCRVILNCVVGEEGEISYVYGRILIIDDEKKMMKEHKDDRILINRLSSTDRLTKLYNRTAFRGRVQEVLKDESMGPVHAICYMDIDNFSFVNEKYGYPAGDRLLVEFAQIFLRKGKKCFGCRPHSDLFIVYINEEGKREVLEKINNWTKLFIEHQEKLFPGINLRVSTGIFFIQSTGTDINQAISNANMARKVIKENKLKSMCIFTDTLKEHRDYEQRILGGVDDAIKNGKIEIFLQPKFVMETNEIVGAEALARWKNDDGSYKNAEDFIPILESSGKIMDLDFCVYTKILQTIRKWKREGREVPKLSVNFSNRHNSYQNFDDRIFRLAEQYNVDPRLIVIEVKENLLGSDVDGLREKVENLRKKGFDITLGSFGTGGSSISFLMNAPVDTVKFDRTIWKNIQENESGQAFVKAIASVAHIAGKNVLFGGIETEEQARMIKNTGLARGQGFLFEKPLRIEEFEQKYLK